MKYSEFSTEQTKKLITALEHLYDSANRRCPFKTLADVQESFPEGRITIVALKKKGMIFRYVFNLNTMQYEYYLDGVEAQYDQEDMDRTFDAFCEDLMEIDYEQKLDEVLGYFDLELENFDYVDEEW